MLAGLTSTNSPVPTDGLLGSGATYSPRRSRTGNSTGSGPKSSRDTPWDLRRAVWRPTEASELPRLCEACWPASTASGTPRACIVTSGHDAQLGPARPRTGASEYSPASCPPRPHWQPSPPAASAPQALRESGSLRFSVVASWSHLRKNASAIAIVVAVFGFAVEGRGRESLPPFDAIRIESPKTSFPRSRVGTVFEPLRGGLNANREALPDPLLSCWNKTCRYYRARRRIRPRKRCCSHRTSSGCCRTRCRRLSHRSSLPPRS